MRMWGVDTKKMCRQHLLGEHLEMHMFAGCLNKGINIEGYLNGLVETDKLVERHRELAREMKKRGYTHSSPFPKIPKIKAGFIDKSLNLLELRRRCKECRKLQDGAQS